MAIDFGRMAMGIGTGYLGAKIANTEANDKLNANIIEQAGLHFYNEELPEYHEREKERKKTYSKVSSRYGKDVANYMDQGGFTDYNEIVEMLGDTLPPTAAVQSTDEGVLTEIKRKKDQNQVNIDINNLNR